MKGYIINGLSLIIIICMVLSAWSIYTTKYWLNEFKRYIHINIGKIEKSEEIRTKLLLEQADTIEKNQKIIIDIKNKNQELLDISVQNEKDNNESIKKVVDHAKICEENEKIEINKLDKILERLK